MFNLGIDNHINRAKIEVKSNYRFADSRAAGAIRDIEYRENPTKRR